MALTVTQLVALQTLPRVGKKRVRALGDKLEGFVSDDELAELCGKSYGRLLQNVTPEGWSQALQAARALLKRTKEAGIGFVGYYDQNYPQILKSTTSEDGTKDESPVVLYYRGDLELLNGTSIALIGSREADPQALKACTYLAEQFAQRGVNIVSGLALGCDTAAHQGALNVGGKTTAVLAHGLDLVFPPQNLKLAHEIVAQGGLLISEYELGSGVESYTFVARDLIQAGCAQAVIVAQARYHGGSMHAAKAAANSGKPLYVVEYSDPEFNQSIANSGLRKLKEDFGAQSLQAVKDKAQMAQTLDAIVANLKAS